MSDTELTIAQTPIEAQASEKVISLLRKYYPNLKGVMPAHMTPGRFGWLCINSIRQTPALAECSGISFINAVLLAANLGLEIRRNSAYLIPFGKECQLLIDYRGKLELARRAGAKAITVELVHENDGFEYSITNDGPVLKHSPLKFRKVDGRLMAVPQSERGEVVLGYVLADLGGKHPQVEVMALDEIEAIRARSKKGCGQPIDYYGKTLKALTLADIRALDWQAFSFKHPYLCPWVTDWDQMARKTLVHRAMNLLPMTPELAVSQEIDNAGETGAPMPVAKELIDIMPQIDPADTHSMVLIPEGKEARAEAQATIAEGAVLKEGPPKNIKSYPEWPDDPEAAALGTWIRVAGVTYCRPVVGEAWKRKE